MARFIIHSIHCQNTFLDSKQIKTFLINTLKKYQRDIIKDEAEIFCNNMDKIPMDEIANNSLNKTTVEITTDQKNFYKQKTEEADRFLHEYEQNIPQRDKEYTLKELRMLQATLYQQNDNNKHSQDLITKDLAPDLELTQLNSNTT